MHVILLQKIKNINLLFLHVTSEVNHQGTMINWDENKTCRVCLTQNDNMQSLFNNSKPNEICKKLEYCTLITITLNEEFPLSICLLCFNELEIAYNFKQKYENSHALLQTHKNKITNEYDKTTEILQHKNKTVNDKTNNPDFTSTDINYKTERKFMHQIDIQCCVNNNKSTTTNQLESKYLCNICGFLCASLSTLKSHLITHSDKLPYSCNLCGKKFKSRASKSFHLKSHSGERNHYCNQCGKRYVNSSGLKYHMRSHEINKQLVEKLFTCKECDKSFEREKDLQTHIILHSGEFPFICDICGRGFNRCNNYKMHMRRHSGIKTFICDICGFALFTSSALNIHKRSHTAEKPYSCEFCDGQFATCSGLNRHKKRFHLFNVY